MASGGGIEALAGSTVALPMASAASAPEAKPEVGTNSAALGLSAAELGLTEAMAVFGRTVVRTCWVGRIVAV